MRLLEHNGCWSIVPDNDDIHGGIFSEYGEDEELSSGKESDRNRSKFRSRLGDRESVSGRGREGDGDSEAGRAIAGTPG